MSLEIEGAIPNWNKFRVAPALPQNLSGDTETIHIETPVEYSEYLTGMISLLYEPNLMKYEQQADRQDVAVAFMQMVIFMSECDAIAGCIESSENVQNALSEYLENYVRVGNNNSGNELSNGSGNVMSHIDCGDPAKLDQLWGACVAIEDYLFATARDWWEIILDTAIDSVSRFRAIGYIPIIGDVPVLDDLNTLINMMRTFTLSAFTTGYSETIRRENQCALWSLCCVDCELTGIDVMSIYADRGELTYSIEDQWSVFFALVAGGTFTEETVVAASMSLVASVLAVGGGVLGQVGILGLNKIAQTGDPDGDWAVYCDPCAIQDYNINVNATTNVAGSGTGIFVRAGATLDFTATGTWCWFTAQCADADGQAPALGGVGFTCPTCFKHALIARVGNGAWFNVGSSATVLSPGNGELQMLMNDDVYNDNSGFVNVDIVVT